MYTKFCKDKANGPCLICNEQSLTGDSGTPNGHVFICGRCGAYRVYEDFIWEMPEIGNPLSEFRYRISWAFRTASERTAEIKNLPFHDKSEVLPMLNAADPSVEEKLGLLLSFLARSSKSPGKYALFDSANDHPIVCARDGDEATFLIESLRQNMLVEIEQQTMNSQGYVYRLTTTGWSELTRRQQRGADSNNVFIAMSFAPERTSVGDVIGNAVTATNHTPVRMDRVEHLNRIDDEILSQLKASKFLVADLTTQNPGAYFEAGFMLGLQRPVIWVCSREDLEKVHFDTRQYNIIDYDDNEDLQKRLRLRIEAVIGKGTAVPPAKS